MKNLKYVGLALFASLISVLLWFHPLPSQASQPTVQVQTEPDLNQVVPNTAPIRIALQALDAAGNPMSDVAFQLQLFTPAKTPWFTTDFPIVEGTQLLDLGAPSLDGKLTFEQVMPIRGNYTLKAQVNPLVAGAFEPFEQTLQLSVPENVVKYRNAAILITILIAAGLGSGWIIDSNQTIEEGEVVSQPVQLLLSAVIAIAIAVLLFVNISAEFASAHVHSQKTHSAATPSIQRSPDMEIRLSGEQQTTVGQLAKQVVQVVDTTTGQPEANAIVSVKSIALENNRQIFTYRGRTDERGELAWSEQFFDGTPHQVVAEVTPSEGTTLQVSHSVAVEGIEPPLYIRFISLGYYTGVFVLALFAGMGFHRRSSKSIAFFRL